MNITRRNLLGLATMGFTQTALLGGLKADAAEYKPLIVVLTRLDSSISEDVLFAFFDSIVSFNIPLGIAIEASPQLRKTATPNPQIADFLTTLAQNYSGMLELMPETENLSLDNGYFQARSAYEIQDTFAVAMAGKAELPPSLRPVSLLSRGETNDTKNVEGIRSSGFRSVFFSSAKSQKTQIRYGGNGLLYISGGISAGLPDGFSGLEKALDKAIETDDFIFVNLSLQGLDKISKEKAFEIGASVGVLIAKRISFGAVLPVLPRDFHLRLASSNYNRVVSVCLDLKSGSSASADASIGLFSGQLQAAGIPATHILELERKPDGETVIPESEDFPGCYSIASAEFSELKKAFREAASRLECVSVKSNENQPLEELQLAGVSVMLTNATEDIEPIGLDKHGILNIPVSFRFNGTVNNQAAAADNRFSEIVGNHRDVIVTISKEAIETAAGRNAILRELVKLSKRPSTKFVSLHEFADTVVSNFNQLELVRRKNFERYFEADPPAILESSEKAELLDDARLAWEYFNTLTNSKTGLAPPTYLKVEGYSSSYNMITNWDVASQIYANLSAFELGFLDKRSFIERSASILASIPSRTMNGLFLPVAEFDSKTLRSNGNAYNACDTGRLLIALKTLSRFEELEPLARKLAESWDLEKTVIDGRLHGIDSSKFVDSFLSNCTHYANRGFGYWNVATRSPYDFPQGISDMDHDMLLMNSVAQIGPIGTEPHALEEVELGYSTQAETLADVLFSAQWDEYRATGYLTAVSEVPLDREPWFTYQGFDVDDENDPWKVVTLAEKRRFETPGFAFANKMFSTKSAFLWAAVRPHSYSSAMLEYARDNAKIPGLGFASGVYQSTQLPTISYSDTNTNGIILEAIAYILRGRKPLATA